VSSPPDNKYTALRRLGDLGREVESRRGPDPYPRAAGPAPSLEQLRRRRDEINRVAAIHGARSVRIFGSIARGDAGPGSDLDVLVEMRDRPSLLEQAALQADLEELLGCPVHVVTTGGLVHAREHTRERIEHEAISL
jgi:predicted nucleotidyltransferase